VRRDAKLQLQAADAFACGSESKVYRAAVTIQRIAHGVAWRRHATGPEGRVAKHDAKAASDAPVQQAAVESGMVQLGELWERVLEPAAHRQVSLT
jgi:hypothetical protein